MSSTHRIAFRYILTRELLGPSLDIIEKLVKEEKWPEARDAIQLFARKLGVSVSGTVDPSISIHTEWFGALDAEDQNVFLSFVDFLRSIADVVWPRAIKSPYAPAFETMRIESVFHNLRTDLRRIEEMRRDDTDAFKHGKFMIIPTKGVEDTSEAVKTLDEASKHVESKFPYVLYGKVYIRKDLKPKGSFDPRPGSGGMIAGAYQAATDSITLSMYATPDRSSLHTLVHELGHRYHTRFIQGEEREKFIQLSTVGDVHEEFFPLPEREKFADEFIVRSTGFRDDDNFGSGGPVHLSERADFFFNNFGREEFKTKVTPLLHRYDVKDDSVIPELRKALAKAQFGGRLRVVADEDNLSPVFASEYGRTSWEENFAESFLAFVLGKALPAPLEKFMRSLH